MRHLKKRKYVIYFGFNLFWFASIKWLLFVVNRIGGWETIFKLSKTRIQTTNYKWVIQIFG